MPQRIEYPTSDGLPMAENTLQFEWIVLIKEGLDAVFQDEEVFVAGDLLWYPVEGNNQRSTAPDVMVAIGRPKGHRGCYLQWEEENVAPQVVFEILSPGKRSGEMTRKFAFYQEFGVEEYYIYDPDSNELWGYLRHGDRLMEIPRLDGWHSPRLGVRFDTKGDALRLIGPNEQPFKSYLEVIAERNQLAERAEKLADRADKLSAQLRALGIEPVE